MSAGGPGACGAPASERERIVRAFVELVAERGYEEVDLAMVGVRAGVDSDAAQRHFASRFACLTAAWDHLERVYMEQLLLACEGATGWREWLRVAAWQTSWLVEAKPTAARFLIVETFAAGPAGRERYQALAERLSSLLDRALGESAGSDPPSSASSRWVIGMFFHYLYSSLASGREEVADGIPKLMFLAVSTFAGTEAGLAELDMPRP